MLTLGAVCSYSVGLRCNCCASRKVSGGEGLGCRGGRCVIEIMLGFGGNHVINLEKYRRKI